MRTIVVLRSAGLALTSCAGESHDAAGYAVDRSRPDLGSEGPGGQQLRDLYAKASVSGIKTVPDQLNADYDVHSRTRPATGTVWVTVTVAALRA